MLILIATNITFAVIYFTRELTLTDGVTTSGQMQVYETDGTTVKNTLAFKEFYAGTSDTDTESLIIKNLATVTVYAC